MEQEVKIGFFKRIKKAIFNLEDYKIFVQEKFSKAVKYIFALIGIVTLILAALNTYTIRAELDKLVSYVKNDFPDFSYADDELSVDEIVEAYDEEYESMLIVDTSDEVSDEQLEEYRSKASEAYYSFILLKDKVYYSVEGEEYETSYGTIGSYIGIDSLTKDELFDSYLNDDGILKITVVIFIYAIITLFVSNVIVLFEDILIVAIFGWLACKICKIDINFAKNCCLAIYSITLSLIISVIYTIVNAFTGFEIQYFSLMYMVIAYIYMMAAILIIKYDSDKTVGQEVPVNDEKPIEVEKVIDDDKKEKKKKEDEEKDNDKNDGKEEKPAEEGES